MAEFIKSIYIKCDAYLHNTSTSHRSRPRHCRKGIQHVTAAAQCRQVRGNRPGYCQPASVRARHRLCSGGWSISVNLQYSEVSQRRTGLTADFPRPRHQCCQVMQLPHSNHQTYPPPAHSVGGSDVSLQFGKQSGRLL